MGQDEYIKGSVMDGELIGVFHEVRECDYKGEHYSVRDNGAVMRHPKPGRKPRPTDNVWTFGKRDEKTAYMYFGTHRIHIIVAIAFLGEHDSKKYVVDHIDTNRCNNRSDNLRWFTRLENALNNPITRKRIEWLCGGDIQKFIDDPSRIRTEGKWPDLEWMRTVTPEEARNAKANLEKWASKPFVPRDSDALKPKKADKEWMFKPPRLGREHPIVIPERDVHISEKPRSSSLPETWWDKEIRRQRQWCCDHNVNWPPSFVPAISPPVAIQVRWTTPSEFPCCPNEVTENVLADYAAKLKPGTVFSRNGLWTSVVIEAVLIDGGSRLAVATYPKDGGIKEAVAVVYARDGLIVHETVRTCFDSNGTKKCMAELQGHGWDGPETIDDYC